MTNQDSGPPSPSTPLTWSLSKLKTFESCPAKYRYKYLLKIDTAKSPAAERGIDMHKTVEMFIKNEIQTLPTDLDFYHGFFTYLRSQNVFPEHKVALNRNWEPVPWDSEEAWLRSVLDLKIVNEPEALLYDWKSGKIYPDHDDQKDLYGLTIFAEHPSVLRVRAIHVYLDLNKNREKLIDRDQVPELRKQWTDRVFKLERSHREQTSYIDPFIPNPGYHCVYCSFSKSQGGPCRF
jgi:hypothetical protein